MRCSVYACLWLSLSNMSDSLLFMLFCFQKPLFLNGAKNKAWQKHKRVIAESCNQNNSLPPAFSHAAATAPANLQKVVPCESLFQENPFLACSVREVAISLKRMMQKEPVWLCSQMFHWKENKYTGDKRTSEMHVHSAVDITMGQWWPLLTWSNDCDYDFVLNTTKGDCVWNYVFPHTKWINIKHLLINPIRLKIM